MVDLELEIAGEHVICLPERAVYWPAASTLLIADAHWGKASTFRAASMPVPDTTLDDLQRLTDAITRNITQRVVFLGDLLHAKQGRAESVMAQITAWRAEHPQIEMVLVRGNHDRGAGDPPEAWRVRCVDAPFMEGVFAFAHLPAVVEGYYTLSGHLHPGVVLSGKARQEIMLPCFWFQRDQAVLPAFGQFTGLAPINARRGDRVIAIADNQVIEISR